VPPILHNFSEQFSVFGLLFSVKVKGKIKVKVLLAETENRKQKTVSPGG
jgi:hypothetical protein